MPSKKEKRVEHRVYWYNTLIENELENIERIFKPLLDAGPSKKEKKKLKALISDREALIRKWEKQRDRKA